MNAPDGRMKPDEPMKPVGEAIDDFSVVTQEPVERLCLDCEEPFASRFPRRVCDGCIEEHEKKSAAGFVGKTTKSIPDGYAGADFDSGSSLLRQRVKPSSKIVEAAHALGRNIMLVGPSGAGKTTLACAMLRQRAKTALGLFATSASIGHDATLFGGKETELLRLAVRRPVLLLDDLGTEVDRSQRLEASHAVGNIIQERHDRKLVTIVTTFRPDAELEARYGDGVLRRLFSNIVIRLGGAA